MTTYWKGSECVLEPKRVEAGKNTVIRISPHHLALEDSPDVHWFRPLCLGFYSHIVPSVSSVPAEA